MPARFTAAHGLLKRRPRFCLSPLWRPAFVADCECRAARSPDSISRLLAQPDAGFRVIGVLYQEFVVRCRIEGLASVVPDPSEFRRMLKRARAGLGSDMAGDDAWQDVSVRASLLPEDMQGVFMMIARAAKEGWPCPSDAAIARAGSGESVLRRYR